MVITEQIDRLASEEVGFERAYSFLVCSHHTVGLTIASAAYTVICPWSDYRMPVAERFMPQIFRAAGYQTAITRKWHLGHGYNRATNGSLPPKRCLNGSSSAAGRF